MTTAKLYSISGAELKSLNLPEQFNEEVNPDLIKRAVQVVQQNSRQRYGAAPEAGKRASAKLSRRRRDYKGGYGKGMSRVPRKVMWKRGSQFGFEGAVAPGMKGGRQAHPAKSEKSFMLDINKKERRKAIRSAIAATAISNYVSVRHKLPKTIPIIIENKFESFEKTKQIKDLLIKLGFENELDRISKKKVRAGKGKNRNRKYSLRRGPLIVFSTECSLEKASRNLMGMECVSVENLNAELLAPGAVPGRLVVWSEAAIEKLAKEKLFTNNPVKKEAKEEK